MSDSIYLAHHGVKGQKWGVRRYQNPDGTLTELGKKRYTAKSYKLEKSSKTHDNLSNFYGTVRYPAAGLAGIKAGVTTGLTTHGVATLSGLYTYTTLSLPAAAAGAAIGAGVVYGGLSGAKAVHSFVAERKRKRMSEIDNMIRKG